MKIRKNLLRKLRVDVIKTSHALIYDHSYRENYEKKIEKNNMINNI